jgi:predicted ABC-type exoprotein transport system permease subunit
MFNFLIDLPLVITCFIIIGLLCLFAWLGLRIVRRYVLPRLRIESEDGHFIATMVHSIMIFYGLAAALILVDVSETHSDAKKIVSGEAAAVAMLYRDVSSYPEPARTLLQNDIRGYLDYVIKEAWQEQQKGQVPNGGVIFMNRFQSTLASFEPTSDGQEIIHAEALRAYNNLIQARRMRLDAVTDALSPVMWMVIILGALIGLTSSFFFEVKDGRLHMIMVQLLAVFIALIIFMILAFDKPFRGDLGISSEAYQLVYDQVMKK